MSSPMDMSLAGIRAFYATGKTPVDLMAALRQRASEFEEHNIWIHLISESELQPWVDALQDKSPDETPLWGVPFVLKDNIDLAGIPTTAACEAFAYTPTESAYVIRQLLDAGALPLGKANLDQFATGLNGTRSPWGPCRNSFDKQYISGGSSAGSAVSVALGLASFSLGTDTAGSGRIPACFNNLIGVKPTRGLLSTTGVVPACRSLDCVSIFALHSDDANEILAAAEGFDEADGYAQVNPHDNSSRYYGYRDGGITLGVLAASDLKFFGDEQYQSAYQLTLQKLQDDGFDLVEIDYAPFDEVARLLYEGPWVAERYVATLPLIEEQVEEVFPVVRDIIAPGGEPSAASLFRAEYRLHDLKLKCASQLAPLDALLTPTAGRLFTVNEMLEEPIRRNSELGYYMNFMNLLNMAAVSVPTAFTGQGLPFGITLGAPAFTDRRLLSIANRILKVCSLTMATSDLPVPSLSQTQVVRTDCTEVVVCGAHLQGMPLNWQLTERGAHLVESTKTSADYRLYAMHEEPIQRPALVRVDEGGTSIDVEVWRLPTAELGSFLQGVAAPLGLGRVSIKDGRQLCGFIAEACATANATDISETGGWKVYQSRL